jgi:hypothetical protein
MKNIIWILLALLFSIPFLVSGQKSDSLKIIQGPTFKNVIKFNPTPMMLWNKKNVTFSYERVLNSRQSFTVGLGYLVFNNLLDDTILNIFKNTTRKKSGLNFSFEYRFYMTKRNSRPIPDGLFLAPFFSAYLYQFENGLDVINTPPGDFAKLSGGFYAFNFGGALGYQFVLWKRMTIDLILIGPALSYYGGKINISGEINGEQIKEINEDLYNKIKEKYPMADDVLFDKTFKKNGRVDIMSVGYRYLLQIGFCF